MLQEDFVARFGFDFVQIFRKSQRLGFLAMYDKDLLKCATQAVKNVILQFIFVGVTGK